MLLNNKYTDVEQEMVLSIKIMHIHAEPDSIIPDKDCMALDRVRSS